MTLYIEIGMMMMSLLEYSIWVKFGHSLLPMIRATLNTFMPYFDPEIDQNDYGTIALLLYIVSYLMWPLMLAKVLNRKF